MDNFVDWVRELSDGAFNGVSTPIIIAMSVVAGLLIIASAFAFGVSICLAIKYVKYNRKKNSSGKTVLGMDCSGFSQLIFSMMGKPLPRNASEQAAQGELIIGAQKGEINVGLTSEDMKLTRGCDLAFFDHGDGKITHVGILIGNGTIIHCSGRVKVEKITAEGILSSENNALYKVGDITHQLHSVRRYQVQ